jgi:hypothetical protein
MPERAPSDVLVLRCARCADSREPWPFAVPRTTAVLTVPAVLKGHPLVYVANTPTGWEALPDGGPYDALKDTCMVCLSCLVDRNPSLREVADLPVGWSAERVGDAWVRSRDSGDPPS